MPTTNIPKQVYDALPAGWQEMGDKLGNEFWDFLSSPNMEAMGDAIEQAQRGIPPGDPTGVSAGAKLGMVFAGKGMKELPRYIKFLRKLRKAAQNPMMPDVRSLKGYSVPPPSKVQMATQAYDEARRTPTMARMAGRLAEVPANQTGRKGGVKAGEFFPFKQLEADNKYGIFGAYSDVPEGRSVRDLHGSAIHEGGHGIDAERLLRTDQDFNKWYNAQLKKYGYDKAPAEQFANRAKAAGEKDFDKFIATGERLKNQLPAEERSIYDSFRNIWEQSEIQKRGAASGDYDTKAYDQISDSWDQLLGGQPSNRARIEGGQAIGEGTAAARLPKGTFVDIKGKVHPMKGDELHIDIIERLRKKSKAKDPDVRGFEVREGQVRVPGEDLLKHKKALAAAFDSAAEMMWLRYGKSPFIMVEVPGMTYASVPLEHRSAFLSNPLGYLKKNGKGNQAFGLDMW